MQTPFSSAGQDTFADLRETRSISANDLSSGLRREKAFFFSRISSCSSARARMRSLTGDGTFCMAARRWSASRRVISKNPTEQHSKHPRLHFTLFFFAAALYSSLVCERNAPQSLVIKSIHHLSHVSLKLYLVARSRVKSGDAKSEIFSLSVPALVLSYAVQNRSNPTARTRNTGRDSSRETPPTSALK